VAVVSIPFHDSESGSTGLIHVENGPWLGLRKVLYFTDTIYGNEGTVICDCRESTPRIRFDKTFSPMGGVEETIRVLSLMLRPFLSGQFTGEVLEDVRAIYRKEYVLENVDPLRETGFGGDAKSVARQVVERVGPGKILVAGCGKGEGLLELRSLGADAWGIDYSPDLEEVVLPEARPWVRPGSVHQIPFEREDGFETLLCLGVLEHLPEDMVRLVAKEAHRLGILNLVTMIDHHDFVRPGHLTLRPLSWWAGELAPFFSPIKAAFSLPLRAPALPWGSPLEQRPRLWTNGGEGEDPDLKDRMAEEIPVLAGESGPEGGVEERR